MSSVRKIYEKIFGSNNEKVLKEARVIVEKTNSFEPAMQALSLEQLKAKTQEFKNRLAEGQTLDDILPEAFATVREVSKRVMNMRHFDVQIIGGYALHKGMISEMRTGEGKTLVGTLPVYLNALEGKGVHLVTVNDYLARRDAVWMGQIYDALGLTVGIIQNQRVSYLYDSGFQATDAGADVPKEEGSELDAERDQVASFKIEYDYLRSCTRQEAYRADITYGTNNEYGFDYLRDNMVDTLSAMVMRPGNELHYAVVDEIDSILIDEARTPLIISAPADNAEDQYYQFAKLATQLVASEDYSVDEKLRSVSLTEAGIKKFETWLGVDNVYAEGGMQMVHHIEQALKAQVLYKRDKEYLVDNGEVIIIDEFTGRKMPGRRYSEGLHQAIEAKEGLKIREESRTMATITFQNYFRMYKKLSGMTGTAQTEEDEFRSIYGLDVLVIPTNKTAQRIDRPDRIYKTELGKIKSIAEKIKECRAKGQPILIGTISVEKNETLSSYLTAQGIAHEILNAKNHEREGEIVANAGKAGAVTLATNMAGRGVDIKLGGALATPEEYDAVVKAGGLFVLGTERHESRRIDNQLRGRSGRQGDPGETQFFVSTDDDLMRIFAGERMKSVMNTLKVPDDMPIEQNMITRMLENAQKKVEAHHFDIRKHLLSYDDILNKQRQVIYKKRKNVLEVHAGVVSVTAQRDSVDESDSESGVESNLVSSNSKTLKEIILGMVESEIEMIISFHTSPTLNPEGDEKSGWDMEAIFDGVNAMFPLTPADKETLRSFAPGEGKLDDAQQKEVMAKFLFDKAMQEYEKLEGQIKTTSGAQENAQALMHEIEKSVLVRAMDMLWIDHLVEMDYLRTGIGLRGYGQRDPLVEYKKESFGLFNALQSNIQKEVVYSFFKVGIGMEIAPSVMNEEKMVLQGAEDTTDAPQSHQHQTHQNQTKVKMSKKERRRQQRMGN